MRNFDFRGSVPSSKSEVARALVIASFSEPKTSRPKFESEAEDVLHADKALAKFLAGGSDFFCGDSATLFRFLALRVARKPGSYTLRGTEALLSRPQEELIRLLSDLGVHGAWRVESSGKKTSFLIHSARGWVLPAQKMSEFHASVLEVDVSRSSQFISAVALSAWGFERNLFLRTKNTFASKPYFKLTAHLLSQAGMNIQEKAEGFLIRSTDGSPSVSNLKIEADWSSAFFVLALGAVGGHARVENLKFPSEQADSRGLTILQSMGFQVELGENAIGVLGAPSARTENSSQNFASAHPVDVDLSQSPASARPVDVDLSQSPDLFPVLASLCATVKGKSRLTGLRNLAFKESDRKGRVIELLKNCGMSVRSEDDSIEIEGGLNFSRDIFDFDPRPDHRLVMAACVLKVAGAKINLLHPETISKSFPEFLKIGREWLQ